MKRSVLSAFALICAITSTHGQNLSPDELARRTVERRAVEAVIWGMPAVNFDLMRQAMERTNGAYNQVAYWSCPPNWKNQTLTPNPNTINFLAFINTTDAGPMVLEIPPADTSSITGTIMEGWQTALEDVGPAGADKGKGGKYLILPPNFKGEVPGGYIVLPSDTYEGYALLRSNLNGSNEADIAKAVAYGRRIKLYPFSQTSNPPATTFIDEADTIFDSRIPYDARFYQSLDHFVQHEPWLERDKAMIDQLKSIGIEKGKPFKPDAKTRDILNEAADEAHAWLEARFVGAFASPYFENTHWALPVSRDVIDGQATAYAKPDVYPVDDRGMLFSLVYFSAKHLGAGQFYLMSIKDRDGRFFDGASTYRLNVPANVPVNLYWSATVYNRATHTLIENVPWGSRSSLTAGLQKNADGSVDIYFGPKAPAGKGSNWVPTKTNGDFEVLFRLYGPQKPLFDKTWVLPDIEKLN